MEFTAGGQTWRLKRRFTANGWLQKLLALPSDVSLHRGSPPPGHLLTGQVPRTPYTWVKTKTTHSKYRPFLPSFLPSSLSPFPLIFFHYFFLYFRRHLSLLSSANYPPPRIPLRLLLFTSRRIAGTLHRCRSARPPLRQFSSPLPTSSSGKVSWPRHPSLSQGGTAASQV